ncbi:Hypothetical protein PHPALM_13338 [Phytophthora palmivora]|uniref:Uncharacterized protein n=1 Tax=Phytophthora palmivora TaxID=4796 RepID=A0A2P4XXQ3_9STRA|nr:Hypothetical protein PHPALM_13338 [Phytophthora palmivora]
MQQSGARLRCDPTDYAKRQLEKKERAKELREQRQRGVFSEEHTFSPKVNPRNRNHPSPPGSREEIDRFSNMAQRSTGYGHSNNHLDDPSNYGNDALDNLSRRYPNKAPPTPQQQMTSLNVKPLEPGMQAPLSFCSKVGSNGTLGIDLEHDTLFREVRRATGREIEDLPIKKTLAPPRINNHTGP